MLRMLITRGARTPDPAKWETTRRTLHETREFVQKITKNAGRWPVIFDVGYTKDDTLEQFKKVAPSLGFAIAPNTEPPEYALADTFRRTGKFLLAPTSSLRLFKGSYVVQYGPEVCLVHRLLVFQDFFPVAVYDDLDGDDVPTGTPAASQQKPLPIPPGDKANFETLLRAVKSGDLALVSAIRKKDGARVSLICAMQAEKTPNRLICPLAVMVEGNPYEDFYDPTETPSGH